MIFLNPISNYSGTYGRLYLTLEQILLARSNSTKVCERIRATCLLYSFFCVECVLHIVWSSDKAQRNKQKKINNVTMNLCSVS